MRLAALALAFHPAAVFADCSGESLYDLLSEAEVARIEAAAMAIPYSEGLFWSAERGPDTLRLIGTFHLSDPRLDELMPATERAMEGAELLLAEMTDVEQAQLETAITTEPDLLLLADGQTLPGLMEPAQWAALAQAAADRQLPGFMAARMQPWYLSLMLAIPSCAIEQVAAGAEGLDAQILDIAARDDIPARALEPWNTLFRIFADEPLTRQIDMLHLSLAAPELQEPAFVATTNDYFDGRIGAIWEMSRTAARMVPGLDRADADALFAEAEQDLLIGRNLAWMEEIATAVDEVDRAVVAVGAAHLQGESGLLRLLERDGWTITRLE